ncbi:fumarylacetoacetate hydrolase family protein [Streptomyces albidoflavus]|uniref:fumarylacetoacetate hydrolase family protein n=1 Tax=Streptomyces TaxID=1883 RepID=UPI000CD4A25D|nr:MULTISPECIES: fumarylacetoacetate hydrolase family protein [Streptomyces]AWL36521.1 hypothetical protein B9S66_30660 [Streptomyces sp. SM17]MBO1288414.1 fumarylacetoacetate hydrolase family protein [Streptomyces sampsonii]MCL6281722.1 fumarylacetoacetate hydrolase family protein [Streptomyces albidoflavus]
MGRRGERRPGPRYPVDHRVVTTFTPLSPGDVIVTGTPGGVGLFMEPPGFITDGDVVEVEVSKLGTLRNTVRDTP